MSPLKLFAVYSLLTALLSLAVHFIRWAFIQGDDGAFSLLQTVLCFAAVIAFEAIQYRRYYGPFGHLPAVRLGGDLSLLTESPRGTASLEWFKKYPDADLILAKGNALPAILFPVSPAALRDLLTTNAYDFVKPAGLSTFLSRVIGMGLVNLEGDPHKRHRRALNSSFNVKHIRALYPEIWVKTGDFLEQIAKELAEMEISGWFSRLTFDVIGKSALSEDFDSMHAEKEHPVVEALFSVLEPGIQMVTFAGLHFILPPWLLYSLPLPAKKIHQRAARQLHTFANEMALKKLEKREKRIENDHNIMSKIVDSGEFTVEELANHVNTFIAAGHETTAGSLTWATHLLTLPDGLKYQKLVRDEIRAAFPSAEFEDGPSYGVMESLPYLNGVIEEVLRLFPLVAFAPREAIRETSIAGTRVPAGTLVFTSAWAINRNPHYWGEDAEKFRPERWIDDGHPNKHGGSPSNYCFMSFLHGPRACIGRDFAKAEIRCVLAGLLGRFELSRLPGDDGTVKASGAITMKPLGGINVRLTKVPGW